jgi:hypothetical protein
MRSSDDFLCENCSHEMTVHDPSEGPCHEPECRCSHFIFKGTIRCFCGHSPSAHVGFFESLPVNDCPCEAPGCNCQGFA